MELRQLRYFIAVAEHLSYSKAAKYLHISVSPLSRQIRQLEDEFGVRLFVRDRRRVTLSDTGRLFLQEAKSLLNHTATVSERLRLAKAGELGALRVGVGLHLGDTVGSIVLEHSKRRPAVDVHCQDIFSTLQNSALRENQIDIGFLRPPVDPALQSEVLYEERLVALMGRTNPLAKRKSVRIADLSDETLFLPDRNVGIGLQDLTLSLFRKAGLAPKISPLEADPGSHGETHKVLLAANKGIFIIGDETSTRVDNGNVAAAVPIDDPGAKIEVRIAWRKNERSAAVLGFIETARRMFADSSAAQAGRCGTAKLAS
ncbi:MAG: LysR family transcriptional regulator [Acidobacteriota bacterium]|nr:LysR family transcriptional regulator [Acidobacteriota bacterium]